ncbi:MAG TPA: hypothetical protein VFS42_08125 [Burkholderiaceae bacterium]|nr:hypothetical protein [Burkholderiaceae bacterium]
MHVVNDRRYVCWGLFHDWDDARADFRRRAVLEIHAMDRPATTPQPMSALSTRPDAVVVMMNPGSSAPRPGFEGREWTNQLVPAKPDAVQYQVMRLMGLARWTHVRVVNLADIRAAKSADLYALIESGASEHDLGAIFANANAAVTPDVARAEHVVCAWGLDRRLAPLARQAQAWIDASGATTMGWRADADFPAWRYPKPVGNWNLAVEWLERVSGQLTSA